MEGTTLLTIEDSLLHVACDTDHGTMRSAKNAKKILQSVIKLEMSVVEQLKGLITATGHEA